jgi:hypothetical protein
VLVEEMELVPHQKQRQGLATVMGFRGPNDHRNNELDDKMDVRRDDRSTQGLLNALLISRINRG